MRHFKENRRRVRSVVGAYACAVIPLALVGSSFGILTSALMLWIPVTGSLFLPLVCNYYTSPYNETLRRASANHVSVTNGVAAALCIAVHFLSFGWTVSDVLLELLIVVPVAGISSWLISWSVFRLVTRFTDPILNQFRGIPAWFECQECGYNLTGNVSARCPECGTPTAS